MNFALCDVTLENGPTDVTRGTHRMEKAEAMKKIDSGEIKIEQITMNLGDVMIRDVRGLHRGTPNKTDIPRPMVVIGYSRKWLFRPEVSIQVPRPILEKLSPRAQHMLRFNPVINEIPTSMAPETYKAFAY
jgi:ectoine hydroxylase-related dioxygenase (phytanoyl-CoA dioxygenase family)